MGLNLKRQFERHRVSGLPVESFYECEPSKAVAMEAALTKALGTAEPFEFNGFGRRLNNFCIGSDPEFVFIQNRNSKKTNAASFGMKPGLAVGCDQNQRLAELRGFPTTSAVTHVAGILSTFRWMWRKYPLVSQYRWRAGAYFDGDGIGGHVHFGRKRPNRDKEVAALDGLATLFKNMELFNKKEWETRQLPDAHNNRGYGKFGDIRQQIHGYEYRTLPSWLCSPLKAFVILTTSKLTVLDPELTPSWMTLNVNFDQGYDLLKRLARYFSGRDDDAWILKALLARPETEAAMRTWSMTSPDFKLNWGFPERWELTNPFPEKTLLPAVIQPTDAEVGEVADLLTGKVKNLAYVVHPPTFKDKIPPNYHCHIEIAARGTQYAGVGDLLHNLVGSDAEPVEFIYGNGETAISRQLEMNWTPEQKALVRKLIPDHRVRNDIGRYTVLLDRNRLGVKHLPIIRELLLGHGLFPLWTINSVEEGSYNAFLKANPKVTKKMAVATTRERVL